MISGQNVEWTENVREVYFIHIQIWGRVVGNEEHNKYDSVSLLLALIS